MPATTSTPVEVTAKPPTPQEVQDEALADNVFASVQTLARRAYLIRFEQTAFDYIVLDAFHQTVAATNRLSL